MSSKKLLQNLFELSKLDFEDLKNVNFATLFKDFLARKDLLINASVIAVCVIASLIILSSGNKKMTTLKNNVLTFEKRRDSHKKFKQVQKDLLTYINNIPEPIPPDNLIDFINELAFKNSIQISSYSPAQKVKSQFHDSTSMSIDVAAKNYKDLWNLVHALENSKYSIRIDFWETKPNIYSIHNDQANQADDGIGMKTKIQIGTIHVKK